MRKLNLYLMVAVLAFAPVSFADASATEDNVSRFYEGKQIKLLVWCNAGGGYDTYARLLSRHMGKYIPGNPGIVVQNMPGAGGLKMTNHLYDGASRDGTVFGTGFRTIATQYILNPDEYGYDPARFSWIGSMNKELSVCVSRQDSPVKAFDDMLTREFILGRSGRGDSARVFLPLLSNLFGARFKEVPGYNGSNEMILALERGEIDGRCGWSWASIVTRNKSWLDEGKINILLQLALEKHPDLPDVPLVLDLTDDPNERKVIETVFSSNLMGRPFFAPPGVPAERLEALRKAFQMTLMDPDFLAEARKMNVEIQLMTGEELHNLVASLIAIPPEILELTKETIRDPSGSTASGQSK